jgi:hypothetical protein
VVTRHLERREELRRLPILQTIAVRLEELVKRLVEHLELLGVEVKSDVGSAVELAQLISPEKINEKIEASPGHFVPRIVQFRAATSFDIAHLRELYDITHTDLPPEIAAAILEIVSITAWVWQRLNTPSHDINTAWISERSDLLFSHYQSVRRLQEWLDKFRREVEESA